MQADSTTNVSISVKYFETKMIGLLCKDKSCNSTLNQEMIITIWRTIDEQMLETTAISIYTKRHHHIILPMN